MIRHSLSWFQILIYVNSSSFRRPPCLWVLSCETKVFPQLSALPPNFFVLKALSHSRLCLSSYLSNLNGLRARIININIKQRLLFIQLALIIEFQVWLLIESWWCNSINWMIKDLLFCNLDTTVLKLFPDSLNILLNSFLEMLILLLLFLLSPYPLLLLYLPDLRLTERIFIRLFIINYGI